MFSTLLVTSEASGVGLTAAESPRHTHGKTVVSVSMCVKFVCMLESDNAFMCVSGTRELLSVVRSTLFHHEIVSSCFCINRPRGCLKSRAPIARACRAVMCDSSDISRGLSWRSVLQNGESDWRQIVSCEVVHTSPSPLCQSTHGGLTHIAQCQ